MGIITAKFGGSSVADAEQIRKVKGIVLSNPSRRYIVVSGPGKRSKTDEKITDLLYEYQGIAAGSRVGKNGRGAAEVFSVIEERFTELKKNLGVEVDIEAALANVAADLKAGEGADYAASRGEFLNAQLIAAFLDYDFVDAAGLVLFAEDGSFLSEETNAALAAELSKHERAVLPGFYGTTPDGKPKTFSRGGSDVTGALVARAVGAELYENWTDVSGFLMADPRVVENPRPVPVISYREQRELSLMGASVLHEDAVTPARLAGIPINIRNTNAPEDEGTMIVQGARAEGSASDARGSDAGGAAPAAAPQLRGIAGKKGYAALRLYKNAVGGGGRLLAQAFAAAARHNIQPDFALTAVDSTTLFFAPETDAAPRGAALDDIVAEIQPDEFTVNKEVTLIGVVGGGVGADSGAAAKALGALSEAGIKTCGACFGVSETNIIISVADKDYEEALRAIYAKFA